MRWLALIGSVLLLTGQAQAQSAKPGLLIVGLPHFKLSSSNVINTQVPDVLVPERQREIEEVVDKLASFRPTRVAVEFPMEKQAALDQRYADYRAGRYRLSMDETDQIGLRLAARLNLPRVDAVDWSAEPPGGWSHYNYPVWAKANGRGDEWQAWVSQGEAKANSEVRLMACTPISTWARRLNSPEYRREDHKGYYHVAQIGDRMGTNPGAAWVGTWYTRNLRILNNLRAIAPRANDRVVAIYGAGHGYLLDQLAKESRDFQVASTLAFLPKSPRDAWTRCPS